MIRNLKATDVLTILGQPDGSFVDFNPQIPNVYATHYFLRASSLPYIRLNIPYRNATIQWLKKKSCIGLNEDNKDIGISDIYYATTSLEYIGLPLDSSEVDNVLESTKSVIGDKNHLTRNRVGFKPDEDNLLAIYRLLCIYDILDVPLEPNEEFESWVIDQWQNWSLNDLPEELPRVAKIFKLLQFFGCDSNDILGYRDCSREIGSYLRTLPEKEKLDLIALEATHTLLTDLRLDQTFPESVIQKLAKSQNRDGGFSLTGNSTSDCRGTYIVLDILSKQDALDNIDQEAVRNFILFHAVLDGGFSLHYQQEPKFDQTFAIYWLLKNSPDECYDVIDIQNTSPDGLYPDEPFTPKELFKMKTIHDQIGGTLPTIEIADFVDEYLDTVSSHAIPMQNMLENIHYSLQLDRDFSTARYRNSTDDTIASTILNTRNANGGFGESDTSSILDTYHAVSSLKYTGNQIPSRTQTINWLRDHQNEDGGFGKRPNKDSISDIVSTYFAIRTLMTLDVEIDNHRLVQSWIGNLRHVNGGWSKYTGDAQEFGPRARFSVLAVDLLRRLGKQACSGKTVPFSASE